MHLQAKCSECGYQHALDEKLLGKMVKCKGCGAPFRVESTTAIAPAKDKPQAKDKTEREAIQSVPPPVPRGRRDDDPDDRPARRHVRDDEDFDDDDRPRRRLDADEKSSLPLILGAVGAGVLVLGGVIALVIVVTNRTMQDQPAVAQVNPPMMNPILAQPQPPQANPNPPVFNPAPQVPPAQENPVDPPKFDPPKAKQPKAKQPRIDPPKIEPAMVAPAIVGAWKAEPDPGVETNKTPTIPKKVYSLTANPTVVFPSTPSPFVAVRFGQFGQEQWQVLDLQTGKNPGGIKGKPDMRDEVLSPDGKFLAGRGTRAGARSTVNVYSFAAGKFLPPMAPDTNSIRHHDFIEGNNILVMYNDQLDTKFEAFNKDTGQQLGQYQRKGHPDLRHNWALSPGRKYLALSEGNSVTGHTVVILNALKGDVVGEISLPKDVGSVKAMAFSPDGAELACYFEHFSQGRLISFKMAKGEIGVDHPFAQSVSSLDQKTFFFNGPIMEWVPDNSGWLFYGQFWIDYPTGAPVHTFAATDDSRRNPHRFVGKDHRVFVNATGQTASLSILPLPSTEIAAKVKAARAGGEKGPAPLPEPKAADVASAKTLGVPGGAIAWTVAPDPAPAAKSLPPLNLRTTPAETAQVMFTDNGQAVVLASIVTNALAQKRFIRADRYSLADGKLLSETVLFPAADAGKQPRIVMPGSAPPVNAAGDVSADGTMLAVRATNDDPRLDVWSLQDNKHLVGWLPYDGDKIEWFRFIDASRLLTMSGNGKLALWKLPECQAIYVGEGYRGAPQVSLGRKYVAVLGPAALEILDTDSGTRRGLLQAPEGGLQTCPAISFSGDGKSLAAVFFNAKGTQIARWNLANGAAEGAPLSAPVATAPLQWAGAKHVLANLTLFDFAFKNAIATYTLPAKGKAAGASPDGRLWFTYETGKDKTLLTAVAVPDPQATDISTAASTGKVAPLILPGSNVRVNVASNNERFRAAIDQTLNNRLQALGYKSGAGGVTLSVNTNVSATGKVLEYELRKAPKFGPALPFGPGGQLVKVQEKQVVCQSLIVDQQGTLLHKAEHVIPMPHSLRFQGDDFQSELEEAMWNQAIAWGNNAPLPTNLYRIHGQLVALPKTVAVQ